MKMKKVFLRISMICFLLGFCIGISVFMNWDIRPAKYAGSKFPILLTRLSVYRMIISLMIITPVSISAVLLGDWINQRIFKKQDAELFPFLSRYILSILHFFAVWFFAVSGKTDLPTIIAGYIISYIILFSILHIVFRRSLQKERIAEYGIMSLVILAFIVWALHTANSVFSFGRIID